MARANAKALRGLETRHEQNQQQLMRDTRTLGQRIKDFFKNPTGVTILLGIMAVAGFIIPALVDLILLAGVVMFWYAITRKATLPFRMPLRSGLPDYNDPLPGSGKPRKARGIYFFGNDRNNNEELWFSNDDMRTHALIFGSTGSGKTEALISIAYNALVQGSGFIYIDGKGDNSLFAKLFSMVRSMGREDDLLLINFMTGAKDIIGPQPKRLSNTMNPFADGSSSMLTQLVVSLMDSGGNSSDGDMWKGRAIAFVEALMKLLVAMRDAGHILLDANTIRYYFLLERLESIVIDRVFPRDGQDAISLDGTLPIILEPIDNYVYNLPGYNKAKKGKQVSQVLEQHGFITMQLTRVFTSLADTYGHILRTNLAEVDLKDVVLNRRILVVLLPALEKSPSELANLGKVVIASLKAMMAAGLGDSVEGDYRDLIERKPTNAPNPYLCILDEYGYYAVEGFAVVPAQARSLGFSVIFAGQDLPAFQKASKEEALSIGANTNIKICMKLEDPLDTWDFFMKTAGESYVSHVSGFQADSRGFTHNYMDSQGAQLEKRARVDLLDLKEQREGEMHIFFKSKIVRARVFYADPKPVKKMRLNQFVKVDGPEDIQLNTLIKGIQRFEGFAVDKEFFNDAKPQASSEIEFVSDYMPKAKGNTLIEQGLATLLAFNEKQAPTQVKTTEVAELADSELNIFMPMRKQAEHSDRILVKDPKRLEQFGLPLLTRDKITDPVDYIERLCGKSSQYANNVANEIIKDMQKATFYPPKITERPDPAQLAVDVDKLVGEIDLVIKQKKAQKEKEGAKA